MFAKCRCGTKRCAWKLICSDNHLVSCWLRTMVSVMYIHTSDKRQCQYTSLQPWFQKSSNQNTLQPSENQPCSPKCSLVRVVTSYVESRISQNCEACPVLSCDQLSFLSRMPLHNTLSYYHLFASALFQAGVFLNIPSLGKLMRQIIKAPWCRIIVI